MGDYEKIMQKLWVSSALSEILGGSVVVTTAGYFVSHVLFAVYIYIYIKYISISVKPV